MFRGFLAVSLVEGWDREREREREREVSFVWSWLSVIEYEGEQMGPSLALDIFVYLGRFYCGCLGGEAKSLANGKVVELHFGKRKGKRQSQKGLVTFT
jgi:hypothetical protein